jgi:uncharacterized membrane protein YphA (DoxX/SURF4 family)
MNYNSVLYALASILLGAVCICFHDFALQWTPVSAGVPLRTPLAYLFGVLLIVGGAAVLTRRFEHRGALLLTVLYGFCAIVLHGWEVAGDPGTLIKWLGGAELAFITAGGLALYSTGAGQLRGTLATIVRLAAGTCALMFGSVHFHYADGTASFVPAWIPPSQHFWAYATGAGYIAAGLALLSGVQARLAATLVTFMMACFVVLLHIPRLIASPELHVEWCMVAVASALTGAAWLVRKYAT